MSQNLILEMQDTTPVQQLSGHLRMKGTASQAPGALRKRWTEHWLSQAQTHASARHPLFQRLNGLTPTQQQVGKLLKNYDAHASVLRRLLLKAATIMPEEAVGYILENVRNEYGNGLPDRRHQLQLQDLALRAGVTAQAFRSARVEPGVKRYIRLVHRCYYPLNHSWPKKLLKSAIASGAILATEIMAVTEFEYMRRSFQRIGLENHVWFDHLSVELEHSDESFELALYFIERHQSQEAVSLGLVGLLDANHCLYDGLLAAIS